MAGCSTQSNAKNILLNNRVVVWSFWWSFTFQYRNTRLVLSCALYRAIIAGAYTIKLHLTPFFYFIFEFLELFLTHWIELLNF